MRFAVISGLWYGSEITPVPKRIERVRSAATAMNSSGELIVSQPAEWCSPIQASWKPSRSSHCISSRSRSMQAAGFSSIGWNGGRKNAVAEGHGGPLALMAALCAASRAASRRYEFQPRAYVLARIDAVNMLPDRPKTTENFLASFWRSISMTRYSCTDRVSQFDSDRMSDRFRLRSTHPARLRDGERATTRQRILRGMGRTERNPSLCRHLAVFPVGLKML